MKKIMVVIGLVGFTIQAHAEFKDPPPPPAKVYSTIPYYDPNNAAKFQYYGGKKPGTTSCTSGCDVKSDAYREEYKKYHKYKAAKDFKKYYDN
ncbi:MAG: hypothetical protein JKY93_10100 [Gammaproteobacteria bacterium]|nr:hypothetical protein [Gammaproteobacteria bacterium]